MATFGAAKGGLTAGLALRSACAVALVLALLGPAFAQVESLPKLRDHHVRKVQPAVPKPRLPQQSPFLTSPPPPAGPGERSDLPIGDGVNLVGRLGTERDDSAAPGEPSALKTKRAPLVPRDNDFAFGKHALTDGVSLGISLDLPSLGGP